MVTYRGAAAAPSAADGGCQPHASCAAPRLGVVLSGGAIQDKATLRATGWPPGDELRSGQQQQSFLQHVVNASATACADADATGVSNVVTPLTPQRGDLRLDVQVLTVAQCSLGSDGSGHTRDGQWTGCAVALLQGAQPAATRAAAPAAHLQPQLGAVRAGEVSALAPAGTESSGNYGAVDSDAVLLLPTVLGRGAFGCVFEGVYRGTSVAVKVLAGRAFDVWPPPQLPALGPPQQLLAPQLLPTLPLPAPRHVKAGEREEHFEVMSPAPSLARLKSSPASLGSAPSLILSAPRSLTRAGGDACLSNARRPAPPLALLTLGDPGRGYFSCSESGEVQRHGGSAWRAAGGEQLAPHPHTGEPPWRPSQLARAARPSSCPSTWVRVEPTEGQQCTGKDPAGQVAGPKPACGKGRAGACADGGAAWSTTRRNVKVFAQEVEVLGRCDHPNVVRLLAACLTPPRVCLVMERCETSLDALIYGRTGAGAGGGGPQLLPLPTVLHIAIQICQGLEYLHPTIVHRDLKPGNVLINNADSPEPVAKLTDFGLSRIRLNTLPTMEPEAGTPAFMAPECYDVRNDIITHRADMYSLGVLLWAMLTGRKPWQGTMLLAMAYKVAVPGHRLPLEHIVHTRCPPRLKDLIRQCWDADPRRRPAAAEAAKVLHLIKEEVAAT